MCFRVGADKAANLRVRLRQKLREKEGADIAGRACEKKVLW
jgi:hypothetical protein